MSDLSFSLQDQAEPSLRSGDLSACERLIVEALDRLPKSPFHICRDMHFSNPPSAVASHFDRIFEAEGKKYKIEAGYTETNGFAINPGKWFFDVFTFESYGGKEDLDWLSDWQSDHYPSMQLTGMEVVQDVFASSAFRESSYDDASSVCELIVVIRFQKLIAKAVPFMNKLDFPLLATSHDFDFIAEFKP